MKINVMKSILILVIIMAVCLPAFTQTNKETEFKSQNQPDSFSYAYISIQGKTFSKKLNVEVDFGDTPEQLKAGKEYSEILTNKKSYAAILNYMAEKHFELVNTQDYNYTFQGSGGTSGIIFIMRLNNK